MHRQAGPGMVALRECLWDMAMQRRKQDVPAERPRGASEETVKLADAASFLLDECRMVLPGIQALFGFQMIAIFNQRFADDLAPREQVLHFVSLSFVALAIALIMTPAVYHRTEGVREVSERFLRNSTRLLVASMVALGFGLCLDYYVVGKLVLGTERAAIPAAGLAIVLTLFWIILPRSQALKGLLDRIPRARATRDPH
jgi:hypothetical protein